MRRFQRIIAKRSLFEEKKNFAYAKIAFIHSNNEFNVFTLAIQTMGQLT